MPKWRSILSTFASNHGFGPQQEELMPSCKHVAVSKYVFGFLGFCFFIYFYGVRLCKEAYVQCQAWLVHLTAKNLLRRDRDLASDTINANWLALSESVIFTVAPIGYNANQSGQHTHFYETQINLKSSSVHSTIRSLYSIDAVCA